MERRALALALVLGACGTTGRGAPDAGHATHPDAAAPTMDSGTSRDGGEPRDAGTGFDAGPVATPDGGPTRTDAATDGGAGPTPPPGTVRCGAGTVSADQLLAACDGLDPVVDLGVGTNTACGELVTDDTSYEVWCSESEIFVWVRMNDVDDPSKITCGGAVPLPDGGVITYSIDRFDWGDSDAPENPLRYTVTDGSPHGDGIGGEALWQTQGTSGGVELPWTVTQTYSTTSSAEDFTAGGSGFVTFEQMRVDCSGVGTSSGYDILFVVPFEWSAP